jgi:nicotinate-nucleotide adenylyltransferase
MNPAWRSGTIGILGGTLDPVHLGHVEVARAARAALHLERVVLVPARLPPHRHHEPVASAFHRFAMAALCATDHDWMAVSDDELKSAGPSFTADTLDRLQRSGFRASQVFFITGADAFAEIETWHRFPGVLELAHFAVVSRPGMPVSMLAQRLPALQARFVSPGRAADTAQQPAVFLIDAVTPDVSSTDVRRRLAAGDSVAGLVPPAVARHIERHQLYGRGQSANHLHGQD